MRMQHQHFFLIVPTCARTHGCAWQEQDWGGAWLFYYGQDAIYVDPGAMAMILDQYAADAL